MPFVDRFLGATGGATESGTSTPSIWFDGDDTTWGTVLGLATSPVWDTGAAVTVDAIRLRWSFGTLHPGYGAAGAFAIDSGSSPTGPWTTVLADSAPDVTAGVTYPQDFEITYDLAGPATARYWRLRSTTANNNDIYTVNGYEDVPADPDVPPVDPGYTPPEPAGPILEIYVHDESASRWGTATWATGPATGTEGVWSGAGWQDVTPQGVFVHWIWGARRPDRGILADQEAASVTVSTFDPDRVLDPANPDSPWAPQLIAGVPIRVSHRGGVIRTGYLDEITYAFRAPDYAGQLAGTDTISMLAQANVPADSALGSTLLTRVQDAIVAAGVEVGGLPVPPGSLGGGGSGPALSARIVGETNAWAHIAGAAREVLWVVAVDSAGGLLFRPWGAPLERGAEITDPMLEDLQTISSEEGTYSIVRALNGDGTVTIERAADPLPRYGRRIYARTLRTQDPESFAAAVLADRAWPGVQYRPGSIRPRTAAEVDMLGRLQIMERVQLTVAGVVSVSGRILGGELWARHDGGPAGARWRFRFVVATDGGSAIGTTILVADDTGDTLVDDATLTDYLAED